MPGLTVEFIGIGPKFANTAKKTNAEGQVRFDSSPYTDPQTGQTNMWLVIARDDRGAWLSVLRKDSQITLAIVAERTGHMLIRHTVLFSSPSIDQATKSTPSCG